MKKSTFRVILAILAVILLLGVFTTLGVFDNEETNNETNDVVVSNCNHDYEKKIVQSGDCLTDTIYQDVCKKCDHKGDSYVLKATGSHKYGTEVVTYSNLSSNSHEVVVTKTCSICGYKDEQKTSQSHVLGEVISGTHKHATCAEAGEISFKCTTCKYTVTKALPKLTVHTYHDNSCTICGITNPDYSGTPNTCTHANKDTAYGDGGIGEYDHYCAWAYDWYCWECNEFGGLTMYCNDCDRGSCDYCNDH